MNDDTLQGVLVDKHLLAALPLGVCLFDDRQTMVLINDAFGLGLGVPADFLATGMSLTESMRILAYQGIFGPGDPEAQALDAARLDPARPRRLRRSRPDGRAYELTLTAMADGFCLATVTEASVLMRQRQAGNQRQARLAATFEGLRQGIAVFDADRRLLLSNSRFAELLGLPFDRLQAGLGFDELARMLRDDADVDGFDAIAAPAQALAQVFAPNDGPAAAGPRRCLVGDGRLVDIGATALGDGGWTVTLSDVSAAAAAEDALRRRTRLLGGILERLPHGLCVFGADRRVSMFNRAFGQLMQDAAVRAGDRWETLVTRLEAAGDYGAMPVAVPQEGERQDGGRQEGDRAEGDGHTAMAEQLLALDLRQPQAWRRRRRDGSAIDVRTTPLVDGGVVCVVTVVGMPSGDAPARTGMGEDIGPDMGTGIGHDMRVMLGSIRQGIILWDHERRLVSCNAIAAGLMRLSEALLTRGRSQHEVLSAMAEKGEFGAWEEAAGRLRPLLAHDAGRPHVERLSGRDGQQIEISADPVAGGGFVWTCTDVTERHHAEEELRRARAAAEAASLAKSSFLATMSHELRTPLNAVIGFSETLSRESGDRVEPGRIAEFANAINDAGKHLLNLVNNILDVARIEAGRFDLASDRIDLPSLVASCVRQATNSARAAEVSLQADIPRDLPVLRGDERRLRQVMAHLLTNAIKFTDAGGAVRIDASLRASDGAAGDLLISVADTGIGIPEADLERVFEPFTQIDGGLSRRAMGSGLGLYFCRALVTAHGGDLTLASRPGKGTTAVIRLPRSRLIEPGMPSQAGMQEHR